MRPKLMRPMFVAIAAIITMSFAGAALAPSPALAASKMKMMRAKMDEMRAKDPQSFAACQTLARQRGFNADDPSNGGNGLMMFIDGCMMGKQH
jgi:hypothetical protein